MLKQVKSATKHTAVYAIGNIVSKIVGIILIPVYTNEIYLSNTDFGALTLLEAGAQLMIGVMSLSMTSSLTRWYWDKRYLHIQKSIFFTTMSFSVALIVPFAFLLVLLGPMLSDLMFQSETFTLLIKLTIISASLQVLNNQIMTLAKIQSRSLLFSFVNSLKFIVSLGLIVYGVVYKGKGLDAIWMASVMVEGLAFIGLMPYVVRNCELKFQKGMLMDMLNYGFPLMLASVSSVILLVTDRFMINSKSGLVDTGIYGLGYRIANTLRLVVTASVMAALAPDRMKKMNDPDNGRFYAKALLYSGFVFAVLALAISLFSYEIIVIFAKSEVYYDAQYVVPFIAVALFFGILKDNAVTGLSIYKKTKIIGGLISLTVFLNIGLNLMLIPLLNIYGAALATVLSQLFLLITIVIFAQKSYRIPYDWIKVVKMLLVGIGIILIGLFIADLNIWFRIGLKFLLLISYPFVLYSLKFYDQDEVEAIKKVFATWKNPSMLRDNLKRLLK